MSPPQFHRAAVIVTRLGRIAVQERRTPSPAADQLLVKVLSAAINPVDWKIHEHGIFIDESDYPSVLGTDAAGVVEEVGSAVSNFQKGDRVFFQGSFATNDERCLQEYAIVASDIVSKIPENISTEAAASIPVAAICGLVGIFHDAGRPFPFNGPSISNEPIVVLGGSSSVGQCTIQLARIAGFSPIITTASASHRELLENLGATHVVDRNAHGADIRAIAPSVSLVFDAISSKDTQKLGIDIINLSTSGAVLLTTLPVDEDVARNSSSAERQNAVTVREVYGAAHAFRGVSVPFWKAIGGWLESGEFVPNRVEVVGGLEDVGKALAKSKAGVSAVKLIINP